MAITQLTITGTLIAPRAIAAALALTVTLSATACAAIVAVAVFVARTIFAGLPVTRLAIAGLAITGLAVAGTVVALLRTAVVAGLNGAGFAGLPSLGRLARFGGGEVRGFGLRLGAFVLEIDVEARGEVVAAEDFAGRAGGLHGPQQAEIVFRVLQIVLSEHPVASRRGVTSELLVLLEDVLGVAADLGALGTVGIEGPVGVLRLGFPPPAAAAATAPAAAIAAALTLHSLEISHCLITVLLPYGQTLSRSACASLQRDRALGPVSMSKTFECSLSPPRGHQARGLEAIAPAGPVCVLRGTPLPEPDDLVGDDSYVAPQGGVSKGFFDPATTLSRSPRSRRVCKAAAPASRNSASTGSFWS